MRAALVLLVVASIPGISHGAEEQGPILTLSVTGPAVPWEVQEAAPPRFALMDDGTVYVGGTAGIETARLEGREIKEIEKALDKIRKIPGLQTRVDLGAGPKSYHLVARKGRPLDITAVGDPTTAPQAFRSIASLLSRLEEYTSPDLRPYLPSYYALSAREEVLAGGCRRWTLPAFLAQAVQAPQIVASSATEGWPKGGEPASVCVGDKHYVVSLRPLLPGERR